MVVDSGTPSACSVNDEVLLISKQNGTLYLHTTVSFKDFLFL